MIDTWNPSNYLFLNAAFISSSLNFEEPIISPIFIPWIHHQPIFHIILNSPSNNLHRMPSQLTPTNMMIHSTPISQEIRIHRKWCLHWSICHDFCLDRFLVWRDWKNFLCEMMVVGIRRTWIRWLTWFWAFRSWLDTFTRLILPLCVMITWRESIGLAPIGIIVQATCHNTFLFVVAPGTVWRTSIATFSTLKSTAAEKVLSWDSGLNSLAVGNADTITHRLDGGKCPTWSTCTLITNLADGLTRWPCLHGVELLREIL